MAITSDTANNKVVKTGNVSGPASYSTTAFVVDLSASFTDLEFLKLEIETAGSTPASVAMVTYNNDGTGFAQGKALVRLFRSRYDRMTVGNVSGNPAGTAVQASIFAAATTTGSSHLHTINHDHPSTTSSTPVVGASNPETAIGGPDLEGHTHAVDIAAFTGNSATGTHTHNRSFEYQHNHAVTNTDTAAVFTEVANGTDLSTTTFRYFSVGNA